MWVWSSVAEIYFSQHDFLFLYLQVAYQLNVDVPCIPDIFELRLTAGHTLNPVVPLFREISKDETDYFRVTYSGSTFGDMPGAGAASVDVTGKNKKGKATAATLTPGQAPV